MQKESHRGSLDENHEPVLLGDAVPARGGRLDGDIQLVADLDGFGPAVPAAESAAAAHAASSSAVHTAHLHAAQGLILPAGLITGGPMPPALSGSRAGYGTAARFKIVPDRGVTGR